MRVYEVVGLSDAELMKSATRVRNNKTAILLTTFQQQY